MACVRRPDWLDQHVIELDALTSYEVRAAYAALLALRAAGELADGEDARRMQVAKGSRIRLAVLEGMDEECWEPDVPALVRRLRDLHARRALAVVGEAADQYAHDFDRPVIESVARVAEALDEVRR